jgi:chitodextrinase
MRSQRSLLRTMSLATAMLAATYVGCATQEDAGEMLSDGSGNSAGRTDAGSGGSASGAGTSPAGGVSGSSAQSQAGMAGVGSGPGIAGSSANVAGASGSNAMTGGSAGTSSAGTSSGGTSSGGAGGSTGAGSGGKAMGGTGTVQPDTTPPSTPGSLQTSAITSTSVTVSWNASTDNVAVTGYRLFNGNSEVTTLTGTIYTFKGLSAGKAYTFGVEAYDAADNESARATKSATTTAVAACDAGHTVATLSHGQGYTANGSACIELSVNQAWNPVNVLLEQTGGGTMSYSFKSCAGNGSGTIASVAHLFEGTNPACNFYVQLTGSGTVVYYD